jgi:hypothetical protein
LLKVRHAFLFAVFGHRENCKTRSSTAMMIYRNAASCFAESCTLERRVNSSIEIVLVGTADPDNLRSD